MDPPVSCQPAHHTAPWWWCSCLSPPVHSKNGEKKKTNKIITANKFSVQQIRLNQIYINILMIFQSLYLTLCSWWLHGFCQWAANNIPYKLGSEIIWIGLIYADKMWKCLSECAALKWWKLIMCIYLSTTSTASTGHLNWSLVACGTPQGWWATVWPYGVLTVPLSKLLHLLKLYLFLKIYIQNVCDEKFPLWP